MLVYRVLKADSGERWGNGTSNQRTPLVEATIRFSVEWNGKILWKDMEWGNRGLFHVSIPAFLGETEEKHKTQSV
jgi:hypothetical protein